MRNAKKPTPAIPGSARVINSMVQQRERRLLALLRRYDCENLESKKILEVGCGTGQWLRDFVKWGARPENVTGIDLLARSRVKSPAFVPARCPY